MKIELPNVEISEDEVRNIAREYVDRSFRVEGVTCEQMILQVYILGCRRLMSELEAKLSKMQVEGDSA